jgi:cyclopropane-fatty-acyl-phospholipid synthase
MAWCANFEASWPRFANQMGERFHRMWRYYLLSCAGAFRARDIQLWQWVLSKEGVAGGYRRPAVRSRRGGPRVDYRPTLASWSLPDLSGFH